MPTKIAVPKHLEFAIVVSQRSLNRLICLAFCLSYFATMGSFVTLALLTDPAREALLSAVMLPLGATGMLLFGVSQLLRIAEHETAEHYTRVMTWASVTAVEMMSVGVSGARSNDPARDAIVENQDIQYLRNQRRGV